MKKNIINLCCVLIIAFFVIFTLDACSNLFDQDVLTETVPVKTASSDQISGIFDLSRSDIVKIQWSSQDSIGSKDASSLYIKNMEFSYIEKNQNLESWSNISKIYSYVSIPEYSPQRGLYQTVSGDSFRDAVHLRGSEKPSSLKRIKINVHAKTQYKLSRDKRIRFVLGIDKNNDGYFSGIVNNDLDEYEKLGEYPDNEIYVFYGERHDIDDASLMPSGRKEFYSIYSTIEIPVPIVSSPHNMKVRLTTMYENDDAYGNLESGLATCVNVREGTYNGFDPQNVCLYEKQVGGYLTNSIDVGHTVDTDIKIRNDNYDAQKNIDSKFYIDKIGVEVYYSMDGVAWNTNSARNNTEISITADNANYYIHPDNINFNNNAGEVKFLKIKLNTEIVNSLVHFKRILIGVDKNGDGVFRKLTHTLSRNKHGFRAKDSYEEYLKQNEIFIMEPPQRKASITIPLDPSLLKGGENKNTIKVRMVLYDFYDTSFVRNPMGSTLCRGGYGATEFHDTSCFVRNTDLNFLEFPHQDGNVIDFNVVLSTPNFDTPDPEYITGNFSICDYIENGECRLLPSDLTPLTHTAPFATGVYNGHETDFALTLPPQGRVNINNLANAQLKGHYYVPSIYMDVRELTYDQLYFMKAHNTYKIDGKGISGITYALNKGIRAIELDLQANDYVYHAPLGKNTCGVNGEDKDNYIFCINRVVEWLDEDNKKPNGGWGGPITIWLDTKNAVQWPVSYIKEVAGNLKKKLGKRIITPNEIRDWGRKQSGDNSLSLRQAVIKNGWPPLKYMDGVKQGTEEDFGDILFVLTGGSWSIDDYGYEVSDLQLFPCVGNDVEQLFEENKWTKNQVCMNMGWDDHLEKRMWIAEKSNFLMHVYSGDTDNFHKAYIAVAHGAQFISRDDINENHNGYLPFVGIRKSVPGIFQLRYKNQTSPHNNLCVGFQPKGGEHRWRDGVDAAMKECDSNDYSETFRYSAETQLRIRDGYSLSCLDIEGADPDIGARIHQWDCDGGRSEKWILKYDGRFYAKGTAPHFSKYDWEFYAGQSARFFKPTSQNNGVFISPGNTDKDYYEIINLGPMLSDADYFKINKYYEDWW